MDVAVGDEATAGEADHNQSVYRRASLIAECAVARFDPHSIPSRLRLRVAEILARTDAVCAEHLDEEYAELAREMAAALARLRPSPIEFGAAITWAAGILHAVGWVNFLDDPTEEPHMTDAALARAVGVGRSTMSAASGRIRDALDLVPMHPGWTLSSRLADNPLAWMVEVNGLLLDAREAPRAVQEQLAREGLIPYVPAADPSGARSVADAILAEAQERVSRTLTANPDASNADIDAALAEVMTEYNRRPQDELGGLTPDIVQRLLDADWESDDSAIRIDASLSVDALAPAATLHDARLVLEMLGARGEAKATPKGNLSRDFLNEFRARMTTREAWDHFWIDDRAQNEQDFGPLHFTRVLLEVAGLIKRRKGAWTRTRRGEQLAAPVRAGELLAHLFRTQFRAFNLAYLDRALAAPGFQRTIGYTLYQYGRVGGAWRKPSALKERIVLPAVVDEAAMDRGYDAMALIVETRFLRPLVRFGLAERRTTERGAAEIIARDEFRKSALFDRVVRFDVR